MTAGGDSGGALTPSSSHAPLRKKQNNRVDADPVILVSPPTKNNVYREYAIEYALSQWEMLYRGTQKNSENLPLT